MRHPGFMAAFADRVGDLDDLSGFIIIFLVCTVVTCFWNDFNRRSHPHTQSASQEQKLEQSQQRNEQNDEKLEKI